MNRYFADLHIHIGRTFEGVPVKISGSKDLTFSNIAHEASERKGIELIGIIDCHSPAVQKEIEACLEQGDMTEAPGGGIRFRNTTILLGSEIEVRDPGLGPAHLLAYLPSLADMKKFTEWMGLHMKNVNLSSQRIYVTAKQLQEEVLSRGGLLIPAHIFTPHKSVYGSCTDRLSRLLDPAGIAAVELGLSADTEMADHIQELRQFTFLTNSDAHSLAKIGREYNEIAMEAPSFAEFAKALRGEQARGIAANYGLNPRLGKYHRTYCANCESLYTEQPDAQPDGPARCAYCGSLKIVRGVMDRIMELADGADTVTTPHRPPYHYQIPLEFLPGLGPKKLNRLIEQLGTEMYIIHKASEEELLRAGGEETAAWILKARSGELQLQSGGGGVYGRIAKQL